MSIELQSLETQLDRIGVELPAPGVNALSVWRAVNATATDDPLADISSKVALCSITPKDAAKAVQAAALALAQREKARAVAQNLDRPFKQAAAAVIQFNGDEIITRMRVPFDREVAIITEAVQLLGATPDASMVRTGGPVIGEMYGRWSEAIARVQGVDHARRLLAELGYGGRGQLQDVSWYVASARDQEQLDEARTVWNAPGDHFTQLISHGYELRLNTATEALELATEAGNVTAQRRAAAAAEKTAADDADTEHLRKQFEAGQILTPRGR